MKRPLFASTAITSAAIIGIGMLMSNAAMAQTSSGEPPASLAVSGTFEYHAGWRNYKGSRGAPSFDIREDLGITVKGNLEEGGYTYGLIAEIRWEGGSNDLETDEVRGYIRHPLLGSIEFGDDDGMSNNFTVYFPVVGFAQLDGDVSGFLPDRVTNYIVHNSDDSSKIIYRTPSFEGLSFGISYAPQQDEGDNVAAAVAEYDNFIEGGIIFDSAAQHNFELPEGVSLQGSFVFTSANYTKAAGPRKREDLLELGFGAQIGYVFPDDVGKMTVGGGIIPHDKKSRAAREEFSWNFGVKYEKGDVSAAFSFSQTEYDLTDSPTDLSWAVGVAYQLATGVELTADYVSYDVDKKQGVVGSDGRAFIVGTNLSF